MFWQTTIDYSCGYLIILIDLFQYQEITQGHFQKLHLQNKTKTFIVGGNHTIYISSFTVLKIEAFYKRCYFKKVKHHHCLCLWSWDLINFYFGYFWITLYFKKILFNNFFYIVISSWITSNENNWCISWKSISNAGSNIFWSNYLNFLWMPCKPS